MNQSIKIISALFSVILFTIAHADQEQQFPDVIAATATHNNGYYAFSVTVSSPYDSAKRYADAYRVISKTGTVFGIRELAHDHASEQPFTRSLNRVKIPPSITQVIIEGRDQKYGWGGATITLELPERQ